MGYGVYWGCFRTICGKEIDHNEKGYVKVEYPNTTGKKYPEFMRPGPAKDVEALRKHYNQGLAHSLNDDYDAAIFKYFEALRYDPNAYQVLYNLGVAYSKKGLYEKAVFQFERYLELNPDAENREETEGIIEQLGEKLRERN